MEITLEKVDLLRNRADVSYKEAKEALEKSGGDVVEALAYLGEINRIRPEKESSASSLWKKTKRIYAKAASYRFIISKENVTQLNINLPLTLLVTIIAMPLVIALIILALLSGCKIRFIKDNGEECCINSNIDKIADKASNFAGKVAQEIKEA